MKKATKITALLGAGALLFNVATTSVMAGPFGGSIAFGVAATAGAAETTAKETLKQSSNETSVTKTVYGGYDSYWAQYTFGEDGFVIGYEKIGRDLSIGKGLREASPPAEVDDNAAGTQDVGAHIGDHTTWYIESPGIGLDGIFGGNGGLFVKYAQSNATLVTTESLHTGAKYGDADLSSDTFGIGFKSGTSGGFMYKVSYEITEFDAVSIASTGSDAATTVSSPGTEIDAIKVSFGYAF